MIYVAPLHNPIAGVVRHMSQRLHEVFDTPVARFEPAFDPELAFDAARQQYNSKPLLSALAAELPAPDAKLIAITGFDLFIPVLTFIFGEAQLNGSVAIASSYRLRESFYGLPDNPALTLERLEKEVVHELGHTFNLTHCGNYQCVMHSSSGVEEVDLKKVAFCQSCATALKTGPS